MTPVLDQLLSADGVNEEEVTDGEVRFSDLEVARPSTSYQAYNISVLNGDNNSKRRVPFPDLSDANDTDEKDGLYLFVHTSII